MSEYRRQSAFLKTLLEHDASAEARALVEQLRLAERTERCLFSACGSVALIGVAGVFGLGYAAVLLPRFFHDSSHFLIQLCSALCLGSLICLVAFAAAWLWYRAVANRIRETGRELVRRMMEARFSPEAGRNSPVVKHGPYAIETRKDKPAAVQAAKLP